MSWKTKVVFYSNYIRVSPTQKTIRARAIVQLRKAGVLEAQKTRG